MVDKTASRLRKMLETRLVGPDSYEFLLKGKRIGDMSMEAPGVAGTLRLDPEYHGMGLGKKMLGEVTRRQPGATLESGQTVTGAGQRLFNSMPSRGYNVDVNSRAVQDEIASVAGFDTTLPGMRAPQGESVYRTALPQQAQIRPVMDETRYTIQRAELPEGFAATMTRRPPQEGLASYVATLRRQHPDATDAQLEGHVQQLVQESGDVFGNPRLTGLDTEMAMKTSSARKDKDIEARVKESSALTKMLPDAFWDLHPGTRAALGVGAGGALLGGGVAAVSDDVGLEGPVGGALLGAAAGGGIGMARALRRGGVGDAQDVARTVTSTPLTAPTHPPMPDPAEILSRRARMRDEDFVQHLEELARKDPRIEVWRPERGEHIIPKDMNLTAASGQSRHTQTDGQFVTGVARPGLRIKDTGEVLSKPNVTFQELGWDYKDAPRDAVLKYLDLVDPQVKTSTHKSPFTQTKQSSARKDKDIELWEAYKKNPGPMTLQPLMRQVEPLIQSQVNKWSGAIARPVLEAKGKHLALEAIKSYNPNAGAALSTHIMNRLQKLSRAVYTHQDAVRVPEYKKLKIHSYMRGQREVMDQIGREPTHDELADHLGWSPGKVTEVQQTMRPEFIESEDFGGDMFERQSVWSPDSQDGLIDMIYYDLDPIDKMIFEHSTGYSGKEELSNPELMKKTGLSQGQLSYRKRKIVDKIDSLMD